MAFKMRGFSPFTKETRYEGPRGVDNGKQAKLENDVRIFQGQYDENPNEKTLKDLNWAKQILEEHKTGA